MEQRSGRFLSRMLERLYGAVTQGPAIDCRPQRSRQRLDLTDLSILGGGSGQLALERLLGPPHRIRLQLPSHPQTADESFTPPSEAERELQLRLIRKLQTIADQARAFANETGVSSLFVGYPLLRVPGHPALLAPLAFIPISLRVSRGRTTASVELEATGADGEWSMPNPALVAWVERQAGRKLAATPDGGDPWSTLSVLAAQVADCLGLEPPGPFGPDRPLATAPSLAETSSAEHAEPDSRRAAIIPSAVLGLFPLAQVSLIRDTEALLSGEPISGPLERFVESGDPERPPERASELLPLAPSSEGYKRCEQERWISPCDPCQAQAVRLARSGPGLVIHGPPGTGKSQTIANIIGDHLARGERVLLVSDKRAALDVVKGRLDAAGLGELCAVVHDARSDQRELYASLKAALEALPELRTDTSAEAGLLKIDRELQKIHDELAEHHRALLENRPGVPSFHELTGWWLANDSSAEPRGPLAEISSQPLGRLEEQASLVGELLERGLEVEFASNPWLTAAGEDLGLWLTRPLAQCREALTRLEELAGAVDALPPAPVLPLGAGDLAEQAQQRALLAAALEEPRQAGHAATLARWARAPTEELRSAAAELELLASHREQLMTRPLDSELYALHRELPLPHSELVLSSTRLEQYLRVARRWFGFLFVGPRLAAARALAHFGLELSPQAGARLLVFLEGLRSRQLLWDHQRRLLEPGAEILSERQQSDGALRAMLEGQEQSFRALSRLAHPVLLPLSPSLRQMLSSEDSQPEAISELRRSSERARAILELASGLSESQLFASSWVAGFTERLKAGEPAKAVLTELIQKLHSVEGVLRIRAGLSQLPAGFAGAVSALLAEGVGAEEGLRALHKVLLHGELQRRLERSAALQGLDARTLEVRHRRAFELERSKERLVRAAILHLWGQRQRGKLLSPTGDRLGAHGAELKRRLNGREARTLKVRQLVSLGRSSPSSPTEGIDPLFDLKPVWMASPETVAQIFPREPLFDTVIFDESSQCRLEHAVPVLTRGRRLVVAGDPCQLPPTRFFESAQGELESPSLPALEELPLERDERHSQSEDLLSAALGLNIHQCYLDVHYRSRDARLINFSNRHFYEGRLQPLPSRPARGEDRIETEGPIAVHRVNGVYERSVNLAEADAIAEHLRGLLSNPESPSLGIACFNAAQRDAIVEAIEQIAADDPDFARALETARSRLSPGGAFEGLFVKNLENVQGDERDRLLISTTYGPDPQGRFVRRFGPLGTNDGGRRLNVLVTRARDRIDLFTSIPVEAYASLPPPTPGVRPNGAWLLLDYLRQAETTAASESVTESVEKDSSPLVLELGRRLGGGFERPSVSSTRGFELDLVGPDGCGVLCDGSRYDKAHFPVEWDLFRAQTLRERGWRVLRVWSPQLFRNPEAVLTSLRAASGRPAASSGREENSEDRTFPE